MASLCNVALIATLTIIVGVDGPPVAMKPTEGENMTLPCHTDTGSPVLWLQRQSPDKMSEVLTIFDGSTLRVVEQFKNEMSLAISTEGDYDLTIHSVQQRHSAQYLCQENGGFGPGETVVRLDVKKPVPRIDNNDEDKLTTSDASTKGTTVSMLNTTIYASVGVTCVLIIITTLLVAVVVWFRCKRAKQNEEESHLLLYGESQAQNESNLLPYMPVELHELLLLKATPLLFREMKTYRMQTVAAVESVRVMSSVSMNWWEAMMTRHCMKRQMRRAIEYDCRPFCLKPRKVHCIEMLSTEKGNHDVWGLAQLRDKIYIAWWMSETVGAFNAESPYQHLSDWDIVVKHLTVPVGFDSCEVENCLYLGDADNRCVWKFDIESVKAAHLDDRWFTLDENDPKGSSDSMWLRVNEPAERLLSLKVIDADNVVVLVVEDQLITGGRLWNGRLVVLGSDTTVKCNIPLPESIVNPWHVIQSQNKYSFIVVHGPVDGPNPHGVTEVSVHGKVTMSSLEEIDLNVPINVTRCTDDGDMFVADECNARIMLMDQQLNLKSVFMQWHRSEYEQNSDPTRVLIDHLRQHILVGLRGGIVEIFSFRKLSSPGISLNKDIDIHAKRV